MTKTVISLQNRYCHTFMRPVCLPSACLQGSGKASWMGKAGCSVGENWLPMKFPRASCHVTSFAVLESGTRRQYTAGTSSRLWHLRRVDMFKVQRALLVSSVASNLKMKSQEVSMMLTWNFSSNLVSGGMTWFLEGTVESTQSTNPQRVWHPGLEGQMGRRY